MSLCYTDHPCAAVFLPHQVTPGPHFSNPGSAPGLIDYFYSCVLAKRNYRVQFSIFCEQTCSVTLAIDILIKKFTVRFERYVSLKIDD